MTTQLNPEAILHGPALANEIPSVTLPEFIRGHARQRPNAVALVDAASGRNYTYGALDHLIGRFAAGLVAQGFKPGDTLLMSPLTCRNGRSRRSARWPPVAC